MRTIVIADDDSLVGRMAGEKADFLISLGDLWDSTIDRAATLYQCERVLAVKGNHDSQSKFPAGIFDMHLTTWDHVGIRFGGFAGSWKYKPRGHYLFEQEEVVQALRSFPAVDVFIAHNSPSGIHERDPDIHQGFDAFIDYIARASPSYFLHGHQHVNQTSMVGSTTVKGVFGEAILEISI